MKPTILATIHGEGFASNINYFRSSDDPDADEYVSFLGDLDIDADGANGQRGATAAYMVHDKGMEFLANGGMRMEGERVVFDAPWGADIVFVDPKTGRPLVLPNGVVPSRTAYMRPATAAGETEWSRQIDSATVPYIVVPPVVIQKTRGVVKGCKARAQYKGRTVDCIVADVGPRTKVGEGSMELARRLGIPDSPRTGGIEKPLVIYELWPGCILESKYLLQRMNGAYVEEPPREPWTPEIETPA